jgi:hypothetical protein
MNTAFDINALKWYLNPPIAAMEVSIETLHDKAGRPFEIEVGEAVIKRWYKVIPQYRPLARDSNIESITR